MPVTRMAVPLPVTMVTPLPAWAVSVPVLAGTLRSRVSVSVVLPVSGVSAIASGATVVVTEATVSSAGSLSPSAGSTPAEAAGTGT